MYSGNTYSITDHSRFYAESSTANGDTLAISPSSNLPFTVTTLSLSSPPHLIISPSKLKETHLYKTEYCRNWTELGECRYGKKCRYAHGDTELRKISRHNRYKTKICRAYHLEGTCLYGSRCTFIHSDNKWSGSTQSMMDTDMNKTVTDDSFSGGDKIRQHSRFFTSNSTPLLATITDKKIWDSKLGLGICCSLDHSTSNINNHQNTFTGYSTAPNDLDNHSNTPILVSSISLLSSSSSSSSSSSYYSSSLSSSTSSSSIKTIEIHQTPCGIISTLDPMSDASLSMGSKRNQ